MIVKQILVKMMGNVLINSMDLNAFVQRELEENTVKVCIDFTNKMIFVVEKLSYF